MKHLRNNESKGIEVFKRPVAFKELGLPPVEAMARTGVCVDPVGWSCMSRAKRDLSLWLLPLLFLAPSGPSAALCDAALGEIIGSFGPSRKGSRGRSTEGENRGQGITRWKPEGLRLTPRFEVELQSATLIADAASRCRSSQHPEGRQDDFATYGNHRLSLQT
jgi:hypothetical protein